MLNKYIIRIEIDVFFAIIALLFLCSAANAQTLAKTKAQNQALAEAQSKLELGAKQQIKQDYRQRLESVITKEEKEQNSPQALDFYIRYMPMRPANAQPGKVGIIDSGAEYSYEFKAFSKLPVEFSLGHRYISIENTTSLKLPAHLVELSSGLEATFPFFNFNKTYLRLGLYPAFFSDGWDFHSSGFRIPVRSFLIYQPDTKWTFIAGVAVYPDFESKVWPILGFIYKPNDRLSFNIVPERPNISYILNNKLTLFAEGEVSSNEFETNKDNLKNVVLQFKETHLGAGVKYKINRFIQSSVCVGGVFNRYLKYRDSLGKVDIKGGMYAEFRAEIRI